MLLWSKQLKQTVRTARLSLHQWFPTGVPQRGVRSAAHFGITAFLLIFYYINCHKLSFITKQGCSQIFLRPEGCCEPKKVKNTGTLCVNCRQWVIKVNWFWKLAVEENECSISAKVFVYFVDLFYLDKRSCGLERKEERSDRIDEKWQW